MSPRVATFLIFIINGAMIGTWLAQIPWVTGQLGISKTEVGLALLCSAAGALVSMTLTGQLLTRTTSRRLIVLAAMSFPLLAALPVVAPSLPVLALGMLVFGAFNGVLDVSMNAHAVSIEREMGRPVLSSMHAGWSLGGLLGAGFVAVASVAGIQPPAAAAVTTVALLGLGLLAFRFLGPGAVGSREAGARISLPSRAVLPVGLLAVLAAIIEGGIGDWVGLYLDQDLGLDPGLAALGFTVFALGLTLGRFAGDALNRRVGAGRLLRGGMAITAGTLVVVLVSANPLVALPGLLLAGVGVANAIPLMFSAGGHIQPSGPSLAAVFTLCYTAFLAGPPILGFIADRIGLPPTMGLLALAAVVAAIVAPRIPGIDASNELERTAVTGTASAAP